MQSSINWGPARTRADFVEQGRRSARMSGTRSPCEPGTAYMPVFGSGRSWQARAFAEGFRAEIRALGREVKE